MLEERNVFDLEKFYFQCESGEKVETQEVIAYIKSYQTIVIWGAAGLGQAIGRFLEQHKISNLVYWDKRYKEIGTINGRKIAPPFSEQYARDSTLVIYSIPNHVIMRSLLKELEDNNYKHVIRGDILYSGVLCPYCTGDTPSASICWMKGECRSVICKRLQTIIKRRKNVKKPGNKIDLVYNCFIINSLCNLSCTHCVQFINNYPPRTRINIPTETICRDIDLWLELIDSVGTISVMGGETFMHPDIVKIVNKFAEHDNFGFISFPTNGLYPIRPQQLEGIEDKRVIIAFGAYQHVANQQELEIYEKNVELVRSYGIAYTESKHLPTWIIPSGLYKVSDDIDYMTKMKQACLMPPRNLQVRAGKVHVCDKGVALYAMGIADYPEDYFDLTQNTTLEEKRNRFREFVDKQFYYTCAYCEGIPGNAPSALQGKIDIFDRKTYEKKIWEKKYKKESKNNE